MGSAQLEERILPQTRIGRLFDSILFILGKVVQTDVAEFERLYDKFWCVIHVTATFCICNGNEHVVNSHN